MQNLIGTGGSRRRIQQFGKAGFRQVMSLFLAQSCPVCDRPATQTFCLDCQRQIYPATDLHRGSSERLSESESDELNATKGANKQKRQDNLHDSRLLPVPSLPVWSLGPYSGSLKRAILAMKYGDRPDVAGPLGAALAQHWMAQATPANAISKSTAPSHFDKSVPPALCAVPIPLHAERYNSRGFNQAELIARAFCQVSELPLLAHGLIRVQATRPQHELGLADRQQNLEQVFQIGPSLSQRFPCKASRRDALRWRSLPAETPSSHSIPRGKAAPAVLLVDDIYTTGTTAQSAAATLRQAGIPVAGIVAVAKAAL